ncbi:hypothetical protein MASR2M15_15020 [Anaerolineales bacterium]
MKLLNQYSFIWALILVGGLILFFMRHLDSRWILLVLVLYTLASVAVVGFFRYKPSSLDTPEDVVKQIDNGRASLVMLYSDF